MWCNFSDLCACFRATIIVNRVWYKDDGALTKVLCAKHTDKDHAADMQTTDISSKYDCCACGTAKYQLTFHSLWTQRDELSDIDTSLLQWSPLVGSSHSINYEMWRLNTLASQGVSNICQLGDTRALEDEIRHQVCDYFVVVVVHSTFVLLHVLVAIVCMGHGYYGLECILISQMLSLTVLGDL